MSEHHHSTEDHGIMAELAKLWEEDTEVALQQCGAQTGHACHSRLPPQLHRLDAQPQRAIGGSPSSDPFLLPGDEQTWEQDDWFLDPATLMAGPRDTLQASTSAACCQALKRRKLPPELLPAIAPTNAPFAAPTATGGMPSSSAASLSYNQGLLGPQAGAAAPPTSCCSFQMPHMHLPSGLISTASGACNPYNVAPGLPPGLHSLNETPNAAAAAAAAAAAVSGMFDCNSLGQHAPNSDLSSTPAWAHGLSTLLTNPPWPPAAPASALPQIQPNALFAALKQQLASQELATNTAMLAAVQQQQQHQGLPGAACGAVPPAAWRASPAPGRSSLAGSTMQQHTHAAKAAPRAGGMGDSEAGSDSDGEGAATATATATAAVATGGGGGARKGSTLQPASYNGRLEDVVTLSDQCPDESCRLLCQVAGCARDLGGFKEYHQRYRICDVHIKLPQVLKDGRLQRFCQQCGRFHDLAAFDANRKSCREQLNKHNARRRRRAQIEAQKSKAMEQLSGTAVLVSALAGAAGGNGGGNGSGNSNEPADGTGGAGIAPAASGDGTSDVGRLLSALMQNPTHLHALRLLLGVQTHPALPALQPFSPEQVASPGGPAAALSGGDGGVGGDASGVVGGEPVSYGLARDVADCKGVWSPGFESDHRALRISMKLFNRTPADLPPDLRQQVTGWLTSMPAALTGAIRPGCVFLTLHLLLGRAAHADALRRGLSSLLSHLRSRTGCSLWHEGAYAVQLGGEMALVAGGKVTATYLDPSGPAPAHPVALEAVTPSSRAALAAGAPPAPRQYPVVTQVAPVCLAVPAKGAAGAGTMLRVTLQGSGLAAPEAELIVRQRGTQLRLPLKAAPDGTSATAEIPFLPAAGPGGAEGARSGGAVGALVSGGVVWLEVARGAWLSPARPLLILDDAAMASEVAQLQQPHCRAELSSEELDALLVDLGMVLAHVGSSSNSGGGGGGAAGAGAVSDCFSGVDHPTVSLKARRLLLFACDMGWAGVAARVLPLATGACACATEVVAAVHASSAPPAAAGAPDGAAVLLGSRARGLSLLHRVVRSGNLALLQGVLHWGAVAGYAWRADRNGPGGITPLHLAALQEDPRILLALLDYSPPGAFTCLQAQDGTTPFHLAFQMGHFSLDHLTGLLADEKLLPSDKLSSSLAAAAAVAAAGQGGAGAGGAAAGEVITAAGPQGREVDPCGKCHCRLPPLVLSIAAACAACGVRVPCLGMLSAVAGGAGATSKAPGHDAARCAGCTTEQQRAAVAAGRAAVVLSGGSGQPLTGRKRPLAELSFPANDPSDSVELGRWSADSANNCAGMDYGAHGAAAAAGVGAQRGGDASDCGHHKGSVFSITALCQGCHANRTLEVM